MCKTRGKTGARVGCTATAIWASRCAMNHHASLMGGNFTKTVRGLLQCTAFRAVSRTRLDCHSATKKFCSTNIDKGDFFDRNGKHASCCVYALRACRHDETSQPGNLSQSERRLSDSFPIFASAYQLCNRVEYLTLPFGAAAHPSILLVTSAETELQ